MIEIKQTKRRSFLISLMILMVLTTYTQDLKRKLIDGKYGYVDNSDKLVIQAIYQYAAEFSEGLSLVGINYKYGYIDKTGKEIIPLIYDSYCFSFKDGIAIVTKDNKKFGVIDKTGKEITPLKYDQIKVFSDEMAQVRENNKIGFIDITGNEIIPLKYDQAESFVDGLARVKKKDKFDYVDKTGREITAFKYDAIEKFQDGLAVVKKGNKYGFVDKTGREVVPVKYDFAFDFSEGMAIIREKVNDKSKYGFIDILGNLIIPPKYDEAGSFSEGLVYVKLDNKYGFIDKTGNTIIPLKYEGAEGFTDGLAAVGLNGKYGFIDKADKQIIAFSFDKSYSFKEGLARVRCKRNEMDIAGKYGFIDKKGIMVIPCQYEDARDFYKGSAQVKKKYDNTIWVDYWGNKVRDYYTTDKIGYEPKPVITNATGEMPDFMKRMKERDEMLKKMDKNYKGTDFSEVEKSYNELIKAGENYVKTEKENAELLKLANAFTSKANELGTNVEIKTKTHTLKVYSSWATIFGNKTEAYPELTTNSSDAILTGKSAIIFAEAPAGWVKKTGKTDKFSETIRLSFEELVPETTLVQQKQKLTDYASTVSGIAKEKVKYLQEEVILNDGRKGVLFFYYTNQAQGIGYLLNCHLYAVSLANPKKVSYYRLHMEGMENQPLAEKEFASWKDYFKKIMLTIKPISN